MNRQDWAPQARDRPRGGFTVAGFGLLPVGAWQVFVGCRLADDDSFVFTGGGYWYQSDQTWWGWVTIAVGTAAVLVGLGMVLATGRLRRLRATVTASLVVVAVSAMNQMFLAVHYPLWSAPVIVLDVFVVWAVATQIATGGKADAGEDRIVR